MPLNEFLRGWFTTGPSPRVPYVRGWKEAAHKFGLGSVAQMRVARPPWWFGPRPTLIALQSSLGTVRSSVSSRISLFFNVRRNEEFLKHLRIFHLFIILSFFSFSLSLIMFNRVSSRAFLKLFESFESRIFSELLKKKVKLNRVQQIIFTDTIVIVESRKLKRIYCNSNP